jgi:hypothetical protein
LNPRVKPSCTREEVERPSKCQMEESKLSSEQYEQEEGEEEEEEYLLNENPEQFFFNNRLVKTFLHEPVDLEWIYEQSQQLREEQEQEPQQEPEQQQQQQQFGEQRIQTGLPEQLMIPINPKLQELLECYRNNSQQQQGQQQREVEQTGEGVKMMPQNEPTMTESVTSSEFQQNPQNPNYLYVILPIRITGENTQQQEQQNIQIGLENIY